MFKLPRNHANVGTLLILLALTLLAVEGFIAYGVLSLGVLH